MAGEKIRCPQCGAKNDDTERCRICGVSLPNAAAVRHRRLSEAVAPTYTAPTEPAAPPIYTPPTEPAEPPIYTAPTEPAEPPIYTAPTEPAPPPAYAEPMTYETLTSSLPWNSPPPSPQPPPPPLFAGGTGSWAPMSFPRRHVSTATVLIATLAGTALFAVAIWLISRSDDTSSVTAEKGAALTSTVPLTTGSDWITFTDPEGHFTAQLPKQPTRQDTDVPIANSAQSARATTYSVGISSSSAVVVTVLNLGPQIIYDMNRGADAAATQLQGTIASKTPGVDAAGHAYLDVVVTIGFTEDRMRLLDAGARVYILQSLGFSPSDNFQHLVAGFTAR